MKKLLITIIALLPVLAFGQSLDRQVIGSAGDYASAGNVQLSWTVGEVATTTESSGNLLITQGFQQPDGLVVGIQSPVSGLSINLFPNPTEDMLVLKLSSKDAKELQLQWFDMLGQVLGKMQTATVYGEYSHEYDLSYFAPGTYFLVMRDKQGRFIESIKVEKLN